MDFHFSGVFVSNPFPTYEILNHKLSSLHAFFSWLDKSDHRIRLQKEKLLKRIKRKIKNLKSKLPDRLDQRMEGSDEKKRVQTRKKYRTEEIRRIKEPQSDNHTVQPSITNPTKQPSKSKPANKKSMKQT